jgi:selenocysteine-specific elongation factor
VAVAGLRVIAAASNRLGFAAGGLAGAGRAAAGGAGGEHERAPDMVGVERERLRRLTLPTLERAAFDALVAELLAAGRIAAARAWLHLPEHQASLAAGDRDLFAVLKPLLDAQPHGPPRVRDIARASGTAEDTVRQLFRRVARAGELYPVAHDHYFTADAVAATGRHRRRTQCRKRRGARRRPARPHRRRTQGGDPYPRILRPHRLHSPRA